MSLVEKSYIELPIHIRNSQYYKNLTEMFDADKNVNIMVDESLYAETLNIWSSDDIQRIVNADAYFGFLFEDRVKILRNINIFWLTTSEPVIKPDPKISFFAAQVHTLLSERASSVIMVCMKLNYPELLTLAIEDHFPRMSYFIPLYSDMYYAICNLSVDCFKIGVNHGFELNKFAVGEIAKRGNRELLELMVSTHFPITSLACEEADSVETLEFLLKHGFKMYYTTIENAALKGNFKKMEFAIANGCEIPANVCECAARNGNIDCMRLAFQHSDVRTVSIMYEIIRKDNLDAFVLAHENGVPTNSECLIITIEHRCVNITPGRIQKLLL